MFEENQEVESSSSSTSSQTTQGGIARMGMVGRTVGTSQNVVIKSTKKDNQHSRNLSPQGYIKLWTVGTSCQTHAFKGCVFTSCVMPHSAPMTTIEAIVRFRIQNYFHNNAKNHVLKLLNWYSNPHVCRTTLKPPFEDDSGSRHTYFIDEFFNFRKIENIPMDAYFIEVKNVLKKMKEVKVGSPKDIMVYYIIKNL